MPESHALSVISSDTRTDRQTDILLFFLKQTAGYTGEILQVIVDFQEPLQRRR